MAYTDIQNIFSRVTGSSISNAEWYGAEVIVADRFYPSSQLCSECGHRQKMPLQVRTFQCECCGIEKDRDFNASVMVMLENYSSAVSKGGGSLWKL